MASLIFLTPRRHLFVWKHRFSHKTQKLVEWFDVGAGWRKQVRTAQDSLKKSRKRYILLFGEKPPVNQLKQKLMWWLCPQDNDMCKVSIWNFQWLWFYRGGISYFPIAFFVWALQQCLWKMFSENSKIFPDYSRENGVTVLSALKEAYCGVKRLLHVK